MGNKELEGLAREMALHAGWDGWDTAKHCGHTLSGNEPDEERQYWLELARIAASRFPTPAVDISGLTQQVDQLLIDAENVNRYGGGENSDGGLEPGVVDWAELRAKVQSLLSAPVVREGKMTDERIAEIMRTQFADFSCTPDDIAFARAIEREVLATGKDSRAEVGSSMPPFAAPAGQHDASDAEPVANDGLVRHGSVPSIEITLRQAEALVEFFGGHDGEVSVIEKPAAWTDQPNGLYAYCTEYPDEGSMYLGPTEVDDELAANGRVTPFTPSQAWEGELPEPAYKISPDSKRPSLYDEEQVRKAIGAAVAGVRDKTLEEAARLWDANGKETWIAKAIRALKTNPASNGNGEKGERQRGDASKGK